MQQQNLLAFDPHMVIRVPSCLGRPPGLFPLGVRIIRVFLPNLSLERGLLLLRVLVASRSSSSLTRTVRFTMCTCCCSMVLCSRSTSSINGPDLVAIHHVVRLTDTYWSFAIIVFQVRRVSYLSFSLESFRFNSEVVNNSRTRKFIS